MTAPSEDAAAFDRSLEGADAEVADIARALRLVVLQAFPGAVEWFDPGDGVLGFGVRRTVRDLCLAIVPHKAHVNLQLVDGIDLPNPHARIEGTGKRARHVKVRSLDETSASWVVEAIAAQVAHRRPDR